MNIRVECYSGYRGEQEPRAFTMGARGCEMREIVDRWLAPDHRYRERAGLEGKKAGHRQMRGLQ